MYKLLHSGFGGHAHLGKPVTISDSGSESASGKLKIVLCVCRCLLVSLSLSGLNLWSQIKGRCSGSWAWVWGGNVGSYCSSENSLCPLEKHPLKDHTSPLGFFRASCAEAGELGTGEPRGCCTSAPSDLSRGLSKWVSRCCEGNVGTGQRPGTPETSFVVRELSTISDASDFLTGCLSAVFA